MASRTPKSDRALDGLPRWLTLAYLVLVAVAVVGTDYVFKRLTSNAEDSAEGLAWVATIMVLVGLGFGLMLLRQIGAARRSELALDQTRSAMRSMNEVLVVPLGPFDLAQLLTETLSRACRTLDSDFGAIYLADDDRRMDRVARFGDESTDFDQSLISGVVRSRSMALPAPEAEGDHRGAVDPARMAAPLISEDRVIGVVAVGSTKPRRYGELDASVLELLAERLAAAVERDRLVERERRSRLAAERARGLLAVLNQAADALAPAVESYDAALGQLVEHVVPSFADWFAVDLLDQPDGSLRAVAGGDQDDLLQLGRETAATWAKWRQFLVGVMSEGVPHLAYASQPGSVVPNAGHPRLMSRLGASSYLVVPIRVRGLSFGTLSFATRPGRRGFRPSDIPPAEALAERVAVTIERVMTYGEAREAERSARRQAVYLRRVGQATMAVSAAPLSEESILSVVAEQARLVTGASQSVVAVTDEYETGRWVSSPPLVQAEQPQVALDRLVRTTNRPMRWHPDQADTRVQSQACLAAPLITAEGTSRGSVVVTRDEPGFDTDEESVLLALAQLASVALDKLRLYQEVQEGQARLEVLIDSSPVAIVELTTGGEPLRWNRTAQDLLGWPELGPVAGFSGGTASDPEGDFADVWARTALGERVGATDGVVRRVDGTTIDVSVTTAPLTSADGRVSSLLAVMEDVSARRRTEEQMSRSERMDAMGRLAGAVAHDFNNLLTVILGYNNLLAQRLAGTPMAGDVAAIASAAQRAAELTNQLLDIGRQQVTTPRAVDVQQFLTVMEPVLRRLVGPAASLKLDLTRQFVLIDPSQLERILLNLVLNAADAMPERGTLSVTADTIELGLEDATLEPGRYVRLTVKDTGSGMDAFALEHCFDPFFTTKDRSKGTGLGLAAVYGIVTQSSGQITVDSVPSAGTTFTILFPAVTSDGPGPETVLAGPTRLSGVERLLLVEDQDDVRRLLRDELARSGYSVVDVSDGPAAIFTADEEGPFDLLITDVIMPGMSGTELARQLGPSGLPVLFISGHVDEALRRDLDPDADLLSKPFTPQVLLERVRLALDRKSTQAAAPPASKRQAPKRQGSKR